MSTRSFDTPNGTNEPGGESLFPTSVSPLPITPPVVLLRQQAVELRNLTGGILTGDVVTYEEEGDSIAHSFFIVAPALDGYRYRLLSLVHGLDSPYPVHIWYDATSGYNADNVGRMSWPAVFANSDIRDEPRLKERLRQIFSSDATRKILESLLAQSQQPAGV